LLVLLRPTSCELRGADSSRIGREGHDHHAPK
jgi:hypothetical protein